MSRTLRRLMLILVVVVAATSGTLLYQSASSAAPLFGEVLHAVAGATASIGSGLSAADGVLPDDATVFDAQYPGVANLDPALARALRAAATAAARDGVQVFINSGWRSRAYQDELLSEAVAEYGSLAEAARWVATADTSPHVAGAAMDVGTDGATWLSRNGQPFGLCQIYRNEPWHFELRPGASSHGCPRMYADPTQDPRMRQ